MGHLTWGQQRVTRPEAKFFVANYKYKLAGQYVKPLILIQMEVSRRAARGVEAVFNNEGVAVVCGEDFEGDLTNAQPALFTKEVFTGSKSLRYQFMLPGPPLKGPTISDVIQPP